MSFRPDVLSVKPGDSVTWVNRDPFPHTVKSDRFDSKIIAAGGSWTYTAKVPGEVPYVCTLHTTMKGMLRVK